MSNAKAVLRRKIRKGEPVTKADIAAAFPDPSEPEYQEGGTVVIYKMMDPKVVEEKMRILAEARSKGLLVEDEIVPPADQKTAEEKLPMLPEAQSVEAQSVEAQSVEAQSVEAQSVEAQSVEAQTSGPWSRAKAARTGENLSASPSKIKCPDTTCVWPNSEDATTCIRCGRSLTQSQQEDIGEDRTVVEKQAMPAEAPNDDEIARPVDPRVVHERLKMLAAALNDGLPVEDEMRPKAPDPRSPAKAAPTGEARSPAPSKIKCPDPTCVWPNSEDATTCVRCGRSLSPQQQNSPDEDRLLEVLSLFSPEQRRALLNVLSLPDSERAAMIGEVHKRGGGSAADLLIDLEEDPIRRVKVLSMLKVLE